MRIFHITSVESAVEILKGGRFIPKSIDLKNNDNGMNCFCFTKRYYMDQYFHGVGVRMIFKWHGSVTITNPNAIPPLQVDILHDQAPWRCFIRAGGNNNALRLVNIYFNQNELESFIAIPVWYRYLPLKIRSKLLRKSKLKFLYSLRNKYINNKLYIKISD